MTVDIGFRCSPMTRPHGAQKEQGTTIKSPFRRELAKSLKASLATARAILEAKSTGRHRITVAITGSSGKTTTAALIAHLFGPKHVFLSHHENTLDSVSARFVKMPIRTRHAVYEVSESEPGQNSKVARFLKPNAVVFTHVNREHWSSLKSFTGIVSEMMGLTRSKKRSQVFMEKDSKEFHEIAPALASRLTSVGFDRDADFWADDIHLDRNGELSFRCHSGTDSIQMGTRLVGTHWVSTVLLAIAVARHCGETWADIHARLSTFSPIPGRCSPIVSGGGALYVCDTAKAPEHSMDTMVQLLKDFRGSPRRTLVVGEISDRRAGGDRRTYQRVYKAAMPETDRLVFFGPRASHVRVPAEDIKTGRVYFLQQIEKLEELLRDEVPGEVIILKGTTAVDHLERVALHRQEAVSCWTPNCGRSNGGRGCFSCEELRAIEKPNTSQSRF